MNRSELTERMHNGENSGVEFKRDDLRPEHLAKEMAALLNLKGGHILLGVDDDRKPIPGADFDALDQRRLINYFRDVRQQDCPEPNDRDSWLRLLINTELMVEDRGRVMPSVGGLLLFGAQPKRYLPQSGITAVAYTGTDRDYDTKAGPRTLRGPIVSLLPATTDAAGPGHLRMPREFSAADGAVETGLIAEALDFVRRNTDVRAWIDPGGTRRERWDYPLDAVREALVNAVAHRDYSITVIDIELALYADRLEVISPGRLPNTVTIDKMRAGYRASRNELIKEILRDYRLIEATGLGVPRKIIRGMREHNGTEADLIEDGERFIVRLWKDGLATP